jgi:adenosine kinase
MTTSDIMTMHKKRYSRIIVLGSLAFDQISNLPGKFSDWIMPDKIHQLNVSFTVESMRREFGGTGGNCAYSLGCLGLKPTLIGVLGTDGEGYKQHLLDSGVNVDHLLIDDELLTASGYVMTDTDDNQIWSFYPGPLSKATSYKLDETSLNPEEDFVALMPSEPTVFVKHLYELVEMKAHFMFDPAFFIPNLSKEDLLLGLNHADIVIGNDYEIALMEKKTEQSMTTWSLGKHSIVIKTLGEKGSEIYTNDGLISIPAEKVKKVVDPTGAGDAYRAGFLSQYVKGGDLKTCGTMASKVAAQVVQTYGTQRHLEIT